MKMLYAAFLSMAWFVCMLVGWLKRVTIFPSLSLSINTVQNTRSAYTIALSSHGMILWPWHGQICLYITCKMYRRRRWHEGRSVAAPGTKLNVEKLQTTEDHIRLKSNSLAHTYQTLSCQLSHCMYTINPQLARQNRFHCYQWFGKNQAQDPKESLILPWDISSASWYRLCHL